MRGSWWLLVVGACSMMACGGDETGAGDDGSGADAGVTDAGDASDGSSSADTTPDIEEPPAPTEVTFTLRNGNPGGQSRWVEVRNTLGAPGWWTIVEDSREGVQLRPHDTCVTDNCDGTSAPCDDSQYEVIELPVGESVTGTWDFSLFEIVAEGGTSCEGLLESTAPSYRVQFCWSPVPPGPDGRLPAATLSCTRLPFLVGIDTDIAYGIEASTTCGDGLCDEGETRITCPDDCFKTSANDLYLKCRQVCRQVQTCDPDQIAEACAEARCNGIPEGFASASTACLNAAIRTEGCAGELSCEDLATYVNDPTATPCAEDWADYETACAP
jgi:hypothetical protein